MSCFRASVAGILLLGVSCAGAGTPAPLPSEESGLVRIPLVLDRGMAWIDVIIAGRAFRLLLDLGGFDTVALTPESLQGMAVTWTGRTRTTLSAMGDVAKAREYVLPAMELGGVVFRELRGTEDLLKGEKRVVQRTGYLGLGLLQRFNLIIDYPARELVLLWPNVAPPAAYAVEEWPSTEFASGVNGVVATVEIDGSKRRLVWDTGASHCVLKTGLQGSAPVRKEGDYSVCTLKAFDVGGHDFGPVDFVLLDFKQPPADGFIGYPFFGKHAVFVDFRNHRLAVRP
ncbi:MAG TPA: hypothetical protein VK661_11790 [Planctomycetota bacterium]|nr:hypothetical protein [Planctomycetota bacterium]